MHFHTCHTSESRPWPLAVHCCHSMGPGPSPCSSSPFCGQHNLWLGVYGFIACVCPSPRCHGPLTAMHRPLFTNRRLHLQSDLSPRQHLTSVLPAQPSPAPDLVAEPGQSIIFLCSVALCLKLLLQYFWQLTFKLLLFYFFILFARQFMTQHNNNNNSQSNGKQTVSRVSTGACVCACVSVLV